MKTLFDDHAKMVKQLLEERAALIGRLDELNKRELTPEEQVAWDALTAQVADLDARVADLETYVMADGSEDMQEAAPPPPPPAAQENGKNLSSIESRLKALEAKVTRRSRPAQPGTGPYFVRDVNDRRFTADRELAFRGWCMQPTGKVTDEHRAAADRIGFDMAHKVLNLRLWNDAERRAQSTSTTAGGYLVPTGFLPSLEKSLLYFANHRDVARVIRTETGNPLQVPTVDDTSNSGERVAENSAFNSQDLTFGQVTLNAYLYNSKLVNVSIQLMQDSAIDVAGMLGELLGQRLGRIQASEFSTGTGSSQPQGIATGAAAGVTAASATAIAVDDILGLVHSVDRAYRDPNTCRFAMHDSILLAVRKLKDSTNQPIFTESYRVGEPDRILGYPVTVFNYMDSTIASTKRTILFGDFSKYVVRDAMDIQIVRMDERYAEYGQVAFVALMRSDARYLNTAAVKRLTH